MSIQPGTRVEVTTARGDRVEMIAVSGETNGRDVRVVWVVEPEEYAAQGQAAYRIPWPSSAVHELRPA
ncbi:MAG: hypothetical protein WCF12_14325 [Propionicimonas sp.]